MFRSRLEARWAALFDFTKVKWQYEPVDLRGWVPDFFLEFPPCSSKHCEFTKSAWAEVKPAMSLDELDKMKQIGMPDPFDAFGFIMLGLNPGIISMFSMSCGGNSAGGVYHFGDICGVRDNNVDELWKTAGNLVQWRGS